MDRVEVHPMLLVQTMPVMFADCVEMQMVRSIQLFFKAENIRNLRVQRYLSFSKLILLRFKEFKTTSLIELINQLAHQLKRSFGQMVATTTSWTFSTGEQTGLFQTMEPQIRRMKLFTIDNLM